MSRLASLSSSAATGLLPCVACRALRFAAPSRGAAGLAPAASFFAPGAAVPAGFGTLGPKPPVKARKPPSQMQRPAVELPPLVALHPQAGNRAFSVQPPGSRKRLADVLPSDALARLRNALSPGVGAAAAADAAAPVAPAAPDTAAAAAAPSEGVTSVTLAALGLRGGGARGARRPTLRALRAQDRASARAYALLYPPSPLRAPAPVLFAVVSLAGKQFKVTPGDCINAERLRGPLSAVGDHFSLPALLVASRDATLVGRPAVQGAAVRCAVEEHAADVKVIVFKKKRRKRYQKIAGHRRMVTRVRILGIDCAGGTPDAPLRAY